MLQKSKKFFLWTGGAFAALYLAWNGQFYSTTFPVTIVHTNDLHGNILPFRGKGGAATIAAFLKKQKKVDLLLDAGDFFQGTPESDLSGGKNTVIVMNELKYDAATIGNHEFDFGLAALEKLSGIATFPFLSANVNYNKKPLVFAKPYIIREVRQANIGILGLTTELTPRTSVPENMKGLEFLSSVETARNIIPEMKNLGADVIIALTHLGFEESTETWPGDRLLAQSVEGIDIIIGGHSHRRVEGFRSGKTLIVQTSGRGSSVGKMTVYLDRKTKKIRRIKNKIVEMDVKKIGEDDGIKKIVSEISEEISKSLSEVIAVSEVDLNRRRGGDSNLGNFLADIMRQYSKTDAAFHNAGGIRTDLKKGDISLRDIYTLNPFDNTIVTMKLTGEQVHKLIELSINNEYGLLQVSGMRITYDKGANILEITINEKPLNEKKLYSVATNSFLASGGDNFGIFKEGKNVTDTGKLFRDVIIEHLKKTKTITKQSARVDGRILIESRIKD
mgnify:CR=1 FL=1